MPDLDNILKPTVHIHPSNGWINDPNGPLYHEGVYHLYFQYNPAEALHQNIRWGHATSTDLVTWTNEAVAIHPTNEFDRDGVYSGMTVSQEGEVVAFYSGFRKDRRYQPVLRATSEDGGASFGPAHQVVAEPAAPLGVVEYRDPFVWRENDQWRMLVGAAMPENVGAAILYESADQLTWTERGVFASATARDMHLEWGVDTGNMWEVPQYLVVDGTPGLIVSAFRRGTGPMRVFVLSADPESNSFDGASCRYLDDGPDWFAASLLTTPDGRTLAWGWGRESLRVPVPMTSWSGLLSFPRELRVRTDGQFGSWPIAELEKLRAREIGALSSGATLAEIPRAFELQAILSREQGPVRIGLHFDCDAPGIEVAFDPESNTVVVDPAGGYDAATIQAVGDEDVEIRWFFDHSISELFVSGGGVATHRVYPPLRGAFSLETVGEGLVGARVWELGA